MNFKNIFNERYGIRFIKYGYWCALFSIISVLFFLPFTRRIYVNSKRDVVGVIYNHLLESNQTIFQKSTTTRIHGPFKSITTKIYTTHYTTKSVSEISFRRLNVDFDSHELQEDKLLKFVQLVRIKDNYKLSSTVRAKRSSTGSNSHGFSSQIDHHILNHLLQTSLKQNDFYSTPHLQDYFTKNEIDFPAKEDIITDQHHQKKNGNLKTFIEAETFCKDQVDKKNSTNLTSIDDSYVEEHFHHQKCAAEKSGKIPAVLTVLYTFIVFCFFIALAIICDDFFVPSLEAISEKLNLSEDVAGATFMAAGSSAPELFTSIAGMGTGSDVGVGTVVGSAVFNLLVIIALTASLTGQVLQLDWRPFIRDSVFYGLSVIIFTLCSWDALFHWWESLLLLLFYGLYILAMKYNAQLMNAITRSACASCVDMKTGQVSPEQTTDVEATTASQTATVGVPDGQSNEINPVQDDIITGTSSFPSSQNVKVLDENKQKCGCCCCCYCNHCKNDVNLPNGPLRDRSLKKNEKHKTVLPIKGAKGSYPSIEDELCSECSQTRSKKVHFKQQPTTNDTKTANDSFKPTRNSNQSSQPQSVDRCSSPPPPYEVDDFSNRHLILNTRCKCGESLVSIHNDCSSLRCPHCCCCGFCAGNMGNGNICYVQKDMVKIKEVYANTATSSIELKSENPSTSSTSTVKTTKEANKPSTSNEKNKNGEESSEKPDQSETGNETLLVFPCLPPIRHSYPHAPGSSHCGPSAKYIFNWFLFILSFPWICAFTWTVPDCSKPETKKWFLFSFLLSIVWIAGISYVMVELVEKIGCLLNIDNYTMGLVVIAIGTSVPDAISSILVAKAGRGDMAVSNAIGSNIFDINLGLGFPFLINSIITNEPVQLLTPLQQCLLDVLPLPIKMVPHVKFGFILLLILFVCLALFFVVRFKLNKTVGNLFIAMYVIFMVYAFVQEKSCHGFLC